MEENTNTVSNSCPWRFANGFVDDALYYGEGQKLYEAAVAAGNDEEADDIMGSYNLAYQQYLSGFTLESFARDYDEAHRLDRLKSLNHRTETLCRPDDKPKSSMDMDI